VPAKKLLETAIISRFSSYVLRLLGTPVDGASLAVFRISFGGVMAWHIAKHFWPKENSNLIHALYVDPAWNFPYYGFEWVRPLPEPWMSVLFAAAGIAALFVMLGFYYRASAAALFLSYLYIFLCEKSKYNNHYYLMCLLAFLLIWMPACARFSLAPAEDREKTIPFWPVFLLRFQIFVMYFYGGIAKLSADWLTGKPVWAKAQKLHTFLSQHLPLPGLVSVEHVSLFIAYGGLFFDLFIGFLLLWKRTRLFGMLLVLVFHLNNQFMFTIGVFPLMAFMATLIFFEADWPVRFGQWLRKPCLKT